MRVDECGVRWLNAGLTFAALACMPSVPRNARVAQTANEWPVTDVVIPPWPRAPANAPPPGDLASPWPNVADRATTNHPFAAVTAGGRRLSEWRGGTVIPVEGAGVSQCNLTMLGSNAKSVGYCVRTVRGPLIVTDLHASGGCRSDLYALGGSLAHPAWVVYVPANTSVHVTGASLAVLDDGELILGVYGPSEAAVAHDLRCSLTWSGWTTPSASVSSMGSGSAPATGPSPE